MEIDTFEVLKYIAATLHKEINKLISVSYYNGCFYLILLHVVAKTHTLTSLKTTHGVINIISLHLSIILDQTL